MKVKALNIITMYNIITTIGWEHCWLSGGILDNVIFSKKSISLFRHLRILNKYSTLYAVYFALELEIKLIKKYFYSAPTHYQWNGNVAHCQPHGGGGGSDSTCK